MQTRNTKQRKPKSPGRRPSRQRRNVNLELGTYLTSGPKIPASLNRNTPFPPSMTWKLAYVDPSFVLQGASPFLVREFEMNSAYDPDPALGGGSPAGFTQMAAIYESYRVEKFTIRYDISSNESGINGITFGLIFRDTQPSTVITTYAAAQNALEVAPSTGPNIISRSSGMDRYSSPSYGLSPGSVLGNYAAYMTDQGYVGTSTSSPAQKVWVALIVLGPTSATNLPNGVITNFYMHFTTRFFSIANTLGIVQQRQIRAEPCYADPILVKITQSAIPGGKK